MLVSRQTVELLSEFGYRPFIAHMLWKERGDELARRVVKKCHYSGFTDWEDLYQTAAEAFLRCLPSWDPKKASLWTYVEIKMVGAIRDERRSRLAYIWGFTISAFKDRVKVENLFYKKRKTIEEIASILNMPAKKVERLLKKSRNTFESDYGEEESFPDIPNITTPEIKLREIEGWRTIIDAISQTLNNRERIVFEGIYFLNRSQKGLALTLGVSRGQISVMRSRLELKLRPYLRKLLYER